MKNISSFVKSTGLFLGAILVFLSLLSYTPKDISFLNSADVIRISNLIGIIGAYLAFGLFFVFGYASYFIPVCFIGMGLDKLGLVRFCGIGKSKLVNFISFLLFTVFLAGFLALFPVGESEIFKASGVIGVFLGTF
ncbi:MAG: DNA translocase FtsK 4TM domain-containing protein, partial [Candidatus Kariarchaeaceae archaeon]